MNTFRDSSFCFSFFKRSQHPRMLSFLHPLSYFFALSLPPPEITRFALALVSCKDRILSFSLFVELFSAIASTRMGRAVNILACWDCKTRHFTVLTPWPAPALPCPLVLMPPPSPSPLSTVSYASHPASPSLMIFSFNSLPFSHGSSLTLS